MKFLLMLVLINPIDKSESLHLHSEHKTQLSCFAAKASIKQEQVIKAYCTKESLIKQVKQG